MHENPQNGPGQIADLSTLILDVDDLSKVIADVGLNQFMDQMIAELRTGIGTFDPTRVEHQIRAGFNYDHPEHGLVEWMPTMVVGDVVSVKTVGYHPSNPVARRLPSVLATTALYDTTTGSLTAMCEATLLTALRTGAASAVITEAVTVDKPITLGVVGCGAQAVTQIHAISRIRQIDRLIVTDVNPAVSASLADRLPIDLADLPSPVVVGVDEFTASIADFDVVCTCTSVPVGDGPVVNLSGAKQDIHINAVGADFAGKTELALDFVRQSVVIPDEVEQCLLEGESQRLARHELGPSLVEVLQDPSLDLKSQATVFDSTGWSYEDLLAAQLFERHAQRLGLGTRVALQRTPEDPYDPYETLRLFGRPQSVPLGA